MDNHESDDENKNILSRVSTSDSLHPLPQPRTYKSSLSRVRPTSFSDSNDPYATIYSFSELKFDSRLVKSKNKKIDLVCQLFQLNQANFSLKEYNHRADSLIQEVLFHNVFEDVSMLTFIAYIVGLNDASLKSSLVDYITDTPRDITLIDILRKSRELSRSSPVTPSVEPDSRSRKVSFRGTRFAVGRECKSL